MKHEKIENIENYVLKHLKMLHAFLIFFMCLNADCTDMLRLEKSKHGKHSNISFLKQALSQAFRLHSHVIEGGFD